MNHAVPQMAWVHIGTQDPGAWMPAYRCRFCGNPVVWVDLDRANPYQFMQLIIWAEQQHVRCADHLAARRN